MDKSKTLTIIGIIGSVIVAVVDIIAKATAGKDE